MTEENPSEKVDCAEHYEAEQGRDEDGGEEGICATELFGGHDAYAQALTRAEQADEEFTDDGADHSQSSGDAQASDDVRGGRGQAEFPQSRPAAGAVKAKRSSKAGSVESRPLRVLAITGNTETMNAEIETDNNPASNQITSSGEMAMIGTVWKKTVYG